MDALRKAAEQALEALEADYTGWPTSDVAEKWRSVKASLRAAPAEQEQEPVAWMVTDKDGRHFIFRINKPEISEGETLAPLYTHPPRREWQGLTDEERAACAKSPFVYENYRAIEARLKEKNHG